MSSDKISLVSGSFFQRGGETPTQHKMTDEFQTEIHEERQEKTLEREIDTEHFVCVADEEGAKLAEKPVGYVKVLVTKIGVMWHTDSVFAKGAFDAFLAKKSWKGTPGIPMLRDHNREMLVGHWTNYYLVGDDLFAEGMFSLRSTPGRDAHGLVLDKAIRGISPGLNTIKWEVPAPGAIRRPNWGCECWRRTSSRHRLHRDPPSVPLALRK